MLSLLKHARFAGLLMLASCSKPSAKEPLGQVIACALDGAVKFADNCTLERVGAQFVVHRPDGGFHRIEAADLGFLAIDGAELATVNNLPDGSADVSIGDARYHIPSDAR